MKVARSDDGCQGAAPATTCYNLRFGGHANVCRSRRTSALLPENTTSSAMLRAVYQEFCVQRTLRIVRNRAQFRFQRGTDTVRLSTRCATKQPLSWCFRERMTGIEPAFSAWEADVLPLNYIREEP